MADLAAVGAFYAGGESPFGTAASYMDHVRVAGVDLSGLERVTIANEFTRQGDYETERLLGGAKGSIVTRHRLHGYSSVLVSAAPSITAALGEGATGWDQFIGFLGSAFGALHAGGYASSQTVGASGTPTDTLTSTSLVGFVEGQPVCWATGTTRRAYEVGWLTSIDTGATPDEAGLLQQPKHDPQGVKVWGGYTAFVRDGAPYHENEVKSWTLRWVGAGAEGGDYVTMYGCQPTGLKLTLGVNQVPILEITWGVAHWEYDTGSAPTVEAWNYPEPEPCIDWQIAIGASSPIYPVTKEVVFDLGLTRVPLEGGHSASGVEGWMATMRRPKLTLTALWDSAWTMDFAAQTARPVTVQIGTQPGRIIALCMPAARLVSLPKRGDRDGITVADLEFEAQLYTGDSGSDDLNPRDSLCRIAFL